MTTLDYHFPQERRYRRHRPVLLSAISVLPVVVLLTLARVQLIHFQSQVGREVLTGTPQEMRFLRTDDCVSTTIVALELLLGIMTVSIVLAQAWHPSALWFLLLYAVILFAGFACAYTFGCEASP